MKKIIVYWLISIVVVILGVVLVLTIYINNDLYPKKCNICSSEISCIHFKALDKTGLL